MILKPKTGPAMAEDQSHSHWRSYFRLIPHSRPVGQTIAKFRNRVGDPTILADPLGPQAH